MSKTTNFANLLLDHIFRNANLANLGDATGLRGSTAAGNLYISAHTADPGVAGNQTTNEANYTGYARVAVVRDTNKWGVPSAAQIANLLAITFAACTAGANTITHLGVGTDPSGAGTLLYSSNLGNSNQGPFTAVVSGNVITIPGTTLVVDDRVAFYSAFGSSLPGGITQGVIYWVKTVSGNDITVSTTQGGAAVTISSAGDGVALKATTLAVSAGITPEIPIGGLVCKEE